jgi:catalase
MQMGVPAGQVNYEPSSLGPDIARASAETGYRTFPNPEAGEQLRIRPESFADHYSQARLFFSSQTEPEQNHIVSALVFELSKCVTPRVRTAMLSRLINIDETLARRVAVGLGAKESIVPAPAPVYAVDMAPSPALSILAKAAPTLKGRKIGCLVSDGSDGDLVKALRAQAAAAGATVQIIAPTVGGVVTAQGDPLEADHKVGGAPSVLFDAVVVAPSVEGGATLAQQADAVDFMRDAYGHLKVIGYLGSAAPILLKAGIDANADDDPGMVSLDQSSPGDFVTRASQGRIWKREPRVRPAP